MDVARRLLVERLISDVRTMRFQTVRLKSLRALSAAYILYRSIGLKENEAYAKNRMKEYQPCEAMEAYRSTVLFMGLAL